MRPIVRHLVTVVTTMLLSFTIAPTASAATVEQTSSIGRYRFLIVVLVCILVSFTLCGLAEYFSKRMLKKMRRIEAREAAHRAAAAANKWIIDTEQDGVAPSTRLALEAANLPPSLASFHQAKLDELLAARSNVAARNTNAPHDYNDESLSKSEYNEVRAFYKKTCTDLKKYREKLELLADDIQIDSSMRHTEEWTQYWDKLCKNVNEMNKKLNRCQSAHNFTYVSRQVRNLRSDLTAAWRRPLRSDEAEVPPEVLNEIKQRIDENWEDCAKLEERR